MKTLYYVLFPLLLCGFEEARLDDALIIDLSGVWKFRLGDHITWRHLNYNDERWDSIFVPATWESQGYQHRGYAWYRKRFTMPEDLLDSSFVLVVGKINDVDQVFVNGTLVGSMGKFPPNAKAERESVREYVITEGLLQKENVIAVRVFSEQKQGGIREGPVGLRYR